MITSLIRDYLFNHNMAECLIMAEESANIMELEEKLREHMTYGASAIGEPYEWLIQFALGEIQWDDVAHPFWEQHQYALGNVPPRKFAIGDRVTILPGRAHAGSRTEIVDTRLSFAYNEIRWMYHLRDYGWWGEGVIYKA